MTRSGAVPASRARRWLRLARRAASRIPHPGTGDLIELVGMGLIAGALLYVHPAAAMALVGAYLILAANGRGR
jgi:hypothetical protein